MPAAPHAAPPGPAPAGGYAPPGGRPQPSAAAPDPFAPPGANTPAPPGPWATAQGWAQPPGPGFTGYAPGTPAPAVTNPYGAYGAYGPPPAYQGWTPAPVFRPLKNLAVALYVLLPLTMLMSLGSVAVLFSRADLLDTMAARPLDVTRDEAREADDAVAGMLGVTTLLLVATAVVFLVWFYRARRNVELFGPSRQRLGPGWSIGGWFCPVVNLWFPKMIAHDVWKASDPHIAARGGKTPGRHAILWTWWPLWVLASQLLMLTRLAYMGSQEDPVDDDTISALQGLDYASGVAHLLLVPAAALAIVLVNRITGFQHERERMAYAAYAGQFGWGGTFAAPGPWGAPGGMYPAPGGPAEQAAAAPPAGGQASMPGQAPVPGQGSVPGETTAAAPAAPAVALTKEPVADAPPVPPAGDPAPEPSAASGGRAAPAGTEATADDRVRLTKTPADEDAPDDVPAPSAAGHERPGDADDGPDARTRVTPVPAEAAVHDHGGDLAGSGDAPDQGSAEQEPADRSGPADGRTVVVPAASTPWAADDDADRAPDADPAGEDGEREVSGPSGDDAAAVTTIAPALDSTAVHDAAATGERTPPAPARPQEGPSAG